MGRGRCGSLCWSRRVVDWCYRRGFVEGPSDCAVQQTEDCTCHTLLWRAGREAARPVRGLKLLAADRTAFRHLPVLHYPTYRFTHDVDGACGYVSERCRCAWYLLAYL